MSEISEQEAREAAKRVQCVELLDMTPDVRSIVMWATNDLSCRDAERAERTKPITAEWCLEKGAISMTPEFVFFRIPDGHNLNVYLDPKDPYVAYGSNSFPAVATRGQLLDLLAALKGGAS